MRGINRKDVNQWYGGSGKGGREGRWKAYHRNRKKPWEAKVKK